MLKLLSAAHAHRLREFLQEAKYTHEELQSNQLLLELPSRSSGNLAVSLDRIREPSLPNLLLRWFFLGVAAESASAVSMVPEPVLAIMLESGILERDGSALRPTVMLTPCDQYVFAADTAGRMESHPSDVVVWPNPTTRLLQYFAIRRPVDAVLDLGAGCGIQGVIAANHSRQVTATDLNPRAAEFTHFNARLNSVENIECLIGDTYEPVENRRFDLILANPPFFITPTSGALYCENSMELDGYCRRVAREAPDYLKEGGYLQMVCEWVQVRGEPWQDRIREWVVGLGCDAWVFHSYARGAADYARERIRQRAPVGAEAETIARWADYYHQRGVEEMHGGMLAMRRRTGRNWVRISDMLLDPGEPFGDAVWQGFACIDWLELHGSDEEMLAARPRLSPDVQLDQQLRQAEGRWQPVTMTLRFTGGIPDSMRLEPAVAEFLVRLDGRQSLGELIASVAQRVKADAQIVQRECLAVVRRSIERRFVLP
jgi:Methyltransferase small domain